MEELSNDLKSQNVNVNDVNLGDSSSSSVGCGGGGENGEDLNHGDRKPSLLTLKSHNESVVDVELVDSSCVGGGDGENGEDLNHGDRKPSLLTLKSHNESVVDAELVDSSCEGGGDGENGEDLNHGDRKSSLLTLTLKPQSESVVDVDVELVDSSCVGGGGEENGDGDDQNHGDPNRKSSALTLTPKSQNESVAESVELVDSSCVGCGGDGENGDDHDHADLKLKSENENVAVVDIQLVIDSSPSSGGDEKERSGDDHGSGDRQMLKHKATEEITECADVQNQTKRICLRDCSVVLDRLMFKEVMVTAPTPEKREVFYVSTYDDVPDSDQDDNDSLFFTADDRYEDWRLVTVDALDYRNLKKRGKKRKKNDIASVVNDNDNETETEPVLKLFMRFPSTQEDVFCVDYATGDMHSILNILSGEGMAAPILDAYLLLRMQQYWEKVKQTEEEEAVAAKEKEMKKKAEYVLRRQVKKKKNFDDDDENSKTPASAAPAAPKKAINYQYLSYNFMPVKDRDQSVSTFKVNMKYFPKLEKDCLRSCQLIAPQFTSKHFYLAVFDFPKQRVQIHDSSWHYLPVPFRIHQLKTILRALVGEDESIQWKFDIVKRSSPQYDEYSCGIYTIYYADTLLKGVHIKRNCRKLPTQTVQRIRKRVVKLLLNTTSVGRRFLEAITF